ncbi:class I SAM-dependent methyltransferase, partial [Paenibacillus sp. TAF58]
MSNIEITANKWNELHNMKKFRLKYPSEIVVQFVFHNFQKGNEINFLDLGAGSGRHTFFLAREGYRVTASDVSASGIQFINELKEEFQLTNIDTVVNSAISLPFDSDSFDGCISFGVLYYF